MHNQLELKMSTESFTNAVTLPPHLLMYTVDPSFEAKPISRYHDQPSFVAPKTRRKSNECICFIINEQEQNRAVFLQQITNMGYLGYP